MNQIQEGWVSHLQIKLKWIGLRIKTLFYFHYSIKNFNKNTKTETAGSIYA